MVDSNFVSNSMFVCHVLKLTENKLFNSYCQRKDSQTIPLTLSPPSPTGTILNPDIFPLKNSNPGWFQIFWYWGQVVCWILIENCPRRSHPGGTVWVGIMWGVVQSQSNTWQLEIKKNMPHFINLWSSEIFAPLVNLTHHFDNNRIVKRPNCIEITNQHNFVYRDNTYVTKLDTM